MEEKDLKDLLEQYTKLKFTGEPCDVVEARTFYHDLFKRVHAKVHRAYFHLVTRLTQNIPFNLLKDDDLETILDDFDYVEEESIVFKELLRLVYDLYKHPSDYNAWVGETIDGEIFYVELKKAMKRVEGMYT